MIDAHSHITISRDLKQNEKNIEDYINNMKLNNIEESIVTVNPFIDDIKCPNNPNHYVKMKNGNEKGHIICKCTACQKIVYEGIDPYIKYNRYLMNKLSKYKNIHVYPVVSVTDTSMQYLIDYYKDIYGDDLKGIKAYTGLSAYSLNDIKPIKSNVNLLVHAGTYPNQNPTNMIEFIKKYQGSFQIAHLGGLELDALEKLNEIDSVLIDISPSAYMYDYYVVKGNNGGLFNKDKIKKVDDMYELLLSKVDLSKIVWGTDVPFSKVEEEKDAFINSKIFSETEKEQIGSKNLRKVL